MSLRASSGISVLVSMSQALKDSPPIYSCHLASTHSRSIVIRRPMLELVLKWPALCIATTLASLSASATTGAPLCPQAVEISYSSFLYFSSLLRLPLILLDLRNPPCQASSCATSVWQLSKGQPKIDSSMSWQSSRLRKCTPRARQSSSRTGCSSRSRAQSQWTLLRLRQAGSVERKACSISGCRQRNQLTEWGSFRRPHAPGQNTKSELVEWVVLSCRLWAQVSTRSGDIRKPVPYASRLTPLTHVLKSRAPMQLCMVRCSISSTAVSLRRCQPPTNISSPMEPLELHY